MEGLPRLVLGIVGLVILFLTWISSANGTDPMQLRKDHLVARLEESCPDLPWAVGTDKHVVKPVQGTNMGKGVDMESESWTVALCETKFRVPCMRQAFHPGPWEVRVVQHDRAWDSSVAWVVPSEASVPAALRVTFPWETRLKKCVEATFPDMPFVALDVRTSGFDIRVLEMNGAFGIPFQWTVGDVDFGSDMLRWCVSRAWEGSQHPERWIGRLASYVANQWFKFQVRQHASRFWF